ncbi:MAG TPA: class I SAM-dependent methyltransferase [Candidatus Eisenbacteria bacterium]|nr:class I SAM-dependent methyltransferase [Candidatus Eisenbacteria bacterium]
MTRHQLEQERSGLIPENNPPEFVAKHLSAYHFARRFLAGKSVLEIGFGDGYGMNYLADAAAEVTGLDIAPQNIPLARAKYPNPKLRFVHFDGGRFPFPDGSFDAACTFQVIEHVPEAALPFWLSEIRRVLKEGGQFYVSTLNLATAMKPGAPYEKNADHEKEYTAPEFEALLRRAFPDVRVYGLYYTARHRLFRRLKKWGLHRLAPVRGHFEAVTVDDFRVLPGDAARSVDLLAVCRK